MELLGWGLDFCFCSKCQKKLSEDNDKSSIFSYSLGGFLCDDCARGEISQTIRIHNKIKMFLSCISKAKFDEKTKYDDVVNSVVLEKCFMFLRRYIDTLCDRKIKVFDKIEKVEKIKTAAS